MTGISMKDDPPIVLADEPAGVLGSGEGKRRLWNALRNLRRALASSPE